MSSQLPPTPFDRRLHAALADLAAADLSRSPPQIRDRAGVEYTLNDRRVLGFCSNDYLGLGARLGPDCHGSAGATASRLVCGDLPEHRTTEQRFATLAGTEDSVLFPSGFQLNLGVLPALLAPEDFVHSDRLNHASLIDGLRLSRTTPTILPHLSAPLAPSAVPSTAIHWWITEALFSMDGDYADPTAMQTHLGRGGCLYLDEAHSFGLFTHNGHATGHAGRWGICPTALVGTLGKAFGCAGAFVAGSATMCRWIRSTARSFVYSTGVSPVLCRQILCAIDLVDGPDGHLRRELLWRNVRHLARRLGQPDHASPIFRLIFRNPASALAVSRALLTGGIHVQAIRPPTVPTSRLRITLSADHLPEHIDHLVDTLENLLGTSLADAKPGEDAGQHFLADRPDAATTTDLPEATLGHHQLKRDDF